MSGPKKLAIIALLVISIQGCKESSIIEKQFNYAIIFSDATELFFWNSKNSIHKKRNTIYKWQKI